MKFSRSNPKGRIQYAAIVTSPNSNVGVFGYRHRVCPDLLHSGNTGYRQISLNGSGLMAEYLTVFVILACPR